MTSLRIFFFFVCKIRTIIESTSVTHLESTCTQKTLLWCVFLSWCIFISLQGLTFIPTRRPLEHLIWFPCFPEDGPPVFSLILQAPNTRLIHYFSAKLTQSPSLLPATPGHRMSCQFCLTIKPGLWRLPPIPSGIFHLTSTSLFSIIHVGVVMPLQAGNTYLLA